MNNSENNNTNKNIVLLITTAGSFLTPALSAALNVALPSIGRELSAPAVLLGWVASAYLLTAAIFLIPLGKVADTYGRKRVFLGGIVISALGFGFGGECCFHWRAYRRSGIAGSG